MDSSVHGRRFLRWMVAAALATLALAGCGGGGSEAERDALSGGEEETLAEADRVQIAVTGVTVSGKVTYASVPNRSDGSLNYGAATRKVGRGLVVEARESGTNTVLARGVTNGSGKYSLTVPTNKRIVIRVQARLLKSAGTGRWDVAVRDNTNGKRLYTMQTSAFSVGTSAVTRNVHAPSGWGGSSYTSTRVAGPFAVADTVYSAIAKVRSAEASARFPKLAIYWSPNNKPSSGNVEDGDIGTSYFTSGDVAIYLLGAADVDTDEYDSTVVAHEWGHYYQYAFSRDDSLGGPHSEGDLLDRTVAFSEGWGNGWSGIALGRSVYADSNGSAQSSGFSFSLSTSPTSGKGWYSESSVQYIFWKLHRAVGFKPIHEAMSGKVKTSVAATSIHSFAAAIGSVSSTAATSLKSLLNSQSISTSTRDPWGAAEDNDGGVAVALPLYRSGTAASPPANVCVTNATGEYNKLGQTGYVRLRSVGAGTHTITVRGPSGSDPDVLASQGGDLKFSEGTGVTESFDVTVPKAGDLLLSIYDYERSGARVCFSVRIN